MTVDFSTLQIKTWFIVLVILPAMAARMRWEHVRCSTDVHPLPEGRLGDNSRFPWLGVLQHNFQYEDITKFAISPAILIHPVYALAGARDVQAIPADRLSNFTTFISLRAGGGRSAMPAVRAVLHPEYPARSVASVALVELDPSSASHSGDNDPGPVLPVCLPYSGVGVLDDNFYTIQMTDQGGALNKKVFKMSYLDDKICDEFYERAGLNYRRMLPVHSVCASAALSPAACVWDDGSALISQQSWAQFKLLGFGVRGPGCGAPARFLYIHRYLEWIEEVIRRPALGSFLGYPGPESGRRSGGGKLVFTQRASNEILMNEEVNDEKLFRRRGDCRIRARGEPIYKEKTTVNSGDTYHAEGFFHIEVHSQATFSCISLRLDPADKAGRSVPEVWVEHHCPRNWDGREMYEKPQWRKCFKYYITTAYVKFGFRFSGSGTVFLTVYTREPIAQDQLDPGVVTGTTKVWQPETTEYFLPRLFRGMLREDTPTEW